MGTCGICGKNAGLTGAKLWKANSWLCSECVKKAGGFGNAPLNGSLEEIREAIEKYNAKQENEVNGAIKEGAVYFIQGVRGRKLTVYQDKAVIKVEASLGSFLTGNISDGEKTIYYSDCVGLQFKESGLQIGYLQLETSASTMNMRASNFFNENSFTFDLTTTTNEQMKEVRDYIQGQIRAIKNGGQVSQSTNVSSADEIKKYKELLDMGAITQEEFDLKKKQLLGL